MIPPPASPLLCPDCSGPIAGTINDRGYCCLCSREVFVQHKRRSPGIATTGGGLAAIDGQWPGDETDAEIDATLSEQHDAA